MSSFLLFRFAEREPPGLTWAAKSLTLAGPSWSRISVWPHCSRGQALASSPVSRFFSPVASTQRPGSKPRPTAQRLRRVWICLARLKGSISRQIRSEEHTSELQSLAYLVCRLLLEKKKKKQRKEIEKIK